MTNCIIIEDQGPAQEIVEQYIGQSKSLDLIGKFADVLEARDFMMNHPVDLIFLDINLPKMSGMDFLRNEINIPKTILTTAYSEFALECYEYNVVDYLLKPYSFERFSKAISKALHIENTESIESNQNIMYAKAGSELLRIDTEDILFIKSEGDYTEVVTSTRKSLISHSLKEWTEKLNQEFVQVHRSYIVNLNFVERVANNKISLGNDVVPIGRSYKHHFIERLKI